MRLLTPRTLALTLLIGFLSGCDDGEPDSHTNITIGGTYTATDEGCTHTINIPNTTRGSFDFTGMVDCPDDESGSLGGDGVYNFPDITLNFDEFGGEGEQSFPGTVSNAGNTITIGDPDEGFELVYRR